MQPARLKATSKAALKERPFPNTVLPIEASGAQIGGLRYGEFRAPNFLWPPVIPMPHG